MLIFFTLLVGSCHHLRGNGYNKKQKKKRKQNKAIK